MKHKEDLGGKTGEALHAQYLRIKQSVGISPLRRPLVQAIICTSRVVQVHICMAARKKKDKQNTCERFHLQWTWDTLQRISQTQENVLSKAISKQLWPVCRTFLALHQARPPKCYHYHIWLRSFTFEMSKSGDDVTRGSERLHTCSCSPFPLSNFRLRNKGARKIRRAD